MKRNVIYCYLSIIDEVQSKGIKNISKHISILVCEQTVN